MGLLLKPAEIKIQTASIIQTMEKENTSLEGINPSINEFVENSDFDGAAWKGMKQQLAGHQSIIQGLICANDEMISDSAELASAVGAEELDEDKILEEIEKLEQQNRIYHSNVDNYMQSKRDLLKSSIGMGTSNEGLSNYYAQQVGNYRELISTNEQALKVLKEKIETLVDIENRTRELYQNSSALYDAVAQGMIAMEKSWTGSGFSLPMGSTWQKTLDSGWENSEYKMRKELEAAGWDKPAIKAYQEYMRAELKGLKGAERLKRIKEIHEETYLVGSKIYELMFDATELDKVELVLKQMNATVDENGFLQLSGKYKFNPNMPPHDSFLKKFAKAVREKYPNTELREEGELARKIHLFRSYIDKHNIDYIRLHFEGKTDYDKLKAYAQKYNIDLDYSTGASFHNRTMGEYDYTKNMKVLSPKKYENDGGRMSEFIIDLETGNFVSQWNVYKQRADGSYESDLSKYDIADCGDVANTESFNYGPSKGENNDRPANDNDSHSRLDVERPNDADIRASVTKEWESPTDFDDSDTQGNTGKYADIVKAGEVDYEAWREVPKDKKQEIYKEFVDYCRNNRNNNPGFYKFWKDYKGK